MSIKVPSLLPVVSDFIFKLIFGDQRNVDILAEFLKSVLNISDSEYDRITVVDPHVKKESKDDKYGILDVKVHTKSGIVINVEIQVIPIPEMKHRSIYFMSKMVTEQMTAGRNHSDIKKSICIIITTHTFVPENGRYHNQFRYRTEDGIEFTDLTEFNTLELNKLPSDTDSTNLWYWMKFIKSDNEEDLDMLAGRSPEMKKAVGILKELSADERTRMLFEEREMARRDYESRMSGARREGETAKALAIAKNLLSMNLPLDQITKATGLTKEELDRLSDV